MRAIIILLIALSKGLYAAPSDKGNSISFIENKNQWEPCIKFKSELPNGAVFITDQGFVYNFRSAANLHELEETPLTPDQSKHTEKEMINCHAYRVNFIGANKTVTYQKSEERPYYHNYFLGNDRSKWAGKVNLFGKVTQQGVYAGIDVAVYSIENKLKYDFVVVPGADPAQIKLGFEGVQPELTVDGRLRIKTSVNEVIEDAPYVYQVVNGKEIAVRCKYKLQHGQLSYAFPDGYNKCLTLFIDPTLIFATYSGSYQPCLNYTSTYDHSGNAYVGGEALSGTGWPVTIGAFQIASVSHDAAINKYNTDGTTLIYSTFYGGSGTEIPNAMIVNKRDELIIVGTTLSFDLPVTQGCYDSIYSGYHQNGPAEGLNIFVAHFNQAGSDLVGATYVGSTGNDVITPAIMTITKDLLNVSPMEVALDTTGNIWIASNTNSNTFPVTANATQSQHSGGTDGVIFQLSADCSQLLYSSYIGGTEDDMCFNILVNHAGHVVICGITKSQNFPVISGALQTTISGGTDGFVSIINAQTGALMQSSYLGTSKRDDARRLQVDLYDNVLVLGVTMGDYPISAGVYHIPGGDVFIDKLSPTLNHSISSTRLGNQQSVNSIGGFNPLAFLHDYCGNTYVGGMEAMPGLPITSDALSDTPRSFWYGVLKPNFAGLLHATYFGYTGGDHTHPGIHRYDPKGILYQGICTWDSFPTTPNAFALTNLTDGHVDNVCFKIDFESFRTNAAFELQVGQKDSICAPYTLNFINTSTPAVYTWDFGDGSPLSHDTNAVHTFSLPGVHTVTLYTDGILGCRGFDTAYMQITVLQLEPPDITTNDKVLCQDLQSVNISVAINNPKSTQTIEWGPDNGIWGQKNTASISINPSLNNVYYVKVQDSIAGLCGLYTTDTVHINRTFINLINNFRIRSACSNDNNGWAGFITITGDTSTINYTWWGGDSMGLITIKDSVSLIPAGNYTVRITTLAGCDTTLYFTIPEEEYKVTFAVDTLVCTGTPVNFQNNSEAYFRAYHWAFDDSTYSALQHPVHVYNKSGVYETMLVGIGERCNDTAYQNITVDAPVDAPSFITDKDSICTGETITFFPQAHPSTINLRWQFGDGWSTSQKETLQHAYDLPGEMEVTLTASFRACPDLDYKNNLKVHPFPQVHLGPESGLCLQGKAITLRNLAHNEPGIYNYRWSPNGDTTAALKVLYPGRYQFSQSNSHGCTTTETVWVHKDCYIDIPNAFTPNGDGDNDYFLPRQLLSQSASSFKMQILNRWGQVIFETTSKEGRGWDGRFNGEEQPIGVYVYVLEITFKEEQSEIYQGNVTLIR